MNKVEGTKKIDVYLYNSEHIVIPRYSTGVYGSAMKSIALEYDKGFYGKFYARKNRLIAINKSGQKCMNGGILEPIGRCIVRNLEETFNCTSFQITGNKSKAFCTTGGGGQQGKMNGAKEKYDRMSEADLVNLTGCLPSCDRFEMAFEDTPDIRTFPGGRNPYMILDLQFEDGSYDVREEYIVYDSSNFIADVGGYLGLLMGHSILSIYYLYAGWLTKIKIIRYVNAWHLT